jgi:hypothetical protein
MAPSDDPGFNVGDAAEDAFKSWCSQVGILATPPAKDRGGWDYHLSLPQGDRVDPIDAPPSLVCYVQVKGHLGEDSAAPAISLSNWNQMIKQVWPWFVCIVLLDRQARPTRCALIHVSEAWVNKALKRIWQNAAGEKRALNDLVMGCPWTDDDCLPELHGRHILDRLRQQIGSDMLAYAREKTRWYQDAGVEGQRHRLSMTWAPDVPEQDLCDFALGKRKSIPVTRIETHEVRFGIALPRETFQDAEIQIPTSRSIGTTLMRIRSSVPPRSTVELACETLSSTSIFPFLSKPYQRVRLVSSLISAELNHREPAGMTVHWNFHIDDGDKVRLSDLERAASAVRALLQLPSSEVEALLPGHENPIKLPTPEPVEDEDLQPRMREFIEASYNAGIVARVFGLDLDDLLVLPDDIFDEGNRLSALASLYSGSSNRVELAVHGVGAEALANDGKPIARVVALGAHLSERFLLQCIAITGTARVSATGDTMEMQNPQLDAVERLVIDKTLTTEAEGNALIADLLRRARAEQERQGRLLILQKDDPR